MNEEKISMLERYGEDLTKKSQAAMKFLKGRQSHAD